MESIEAEHKKLKESVESLTNTKRELEIDCHHLDDLTDTHTQSLATYRQSESVGIGLKELKLFHNTVKEIAVANHIHEKDAYNKFYADVEEQYDATLGFEPKIQKSKSELQDNALKMQNMDSRIATQYQNNESVKRFMSSILGTQIEQ